MSGNISAFVFKCPDCDNYGVAIVVGISSSGDMAFMCICASEPDVCETVDFYRSFTASQIMHSIITSQKNGIDTPELVAKSLQDIAEEYLGIVMDMEEYINETYLDDLELFREQVEKGGKDIAKEAQAFVDYTLDVQSDPLPDEEINGKWWMKWRKKR